jgi:diguanylate cyclase (GGDEF)-like protein
MPGLTSLGREMSLAVDEVVADLRERTYGSSCVLDDDIEELFLTAARTATEAFALWLATGDPERARRAGQGASRVFGELAARDDAPLNEMTKRCIRWHDAVAARLASDAQRLAIGNELYQALSMLQRSLFVTLVRMTETFESERQSVHSMLLDRQEEIIFHASHDQLTGLPNRDLIIDRIEQLLVRHNRFGTKAVVFFINIDNFKPINDNLGHGAGDQLLRRVAERLDQVLRESDTLGRLGGDEFVVVADRIRTADAASLMCERLLAVLREALAPEGLVSAPVALTACIGVASGTELPGHELLKNAGIAMHRAKRQGANRYVHFEPEMQRAVVTRFELETDLRRAVERGEFILDYQPVFDLASLSITGAEALLRWKHPTRGIVAPGAFISYLEESDLISVVGRWVLNEAIRRAAGWTRYGRPLEISINLSARQLDQDQILTEINSALEGTGLDPRSLCVEVTETTLMRDLDEALKRLRAIKALGVRIAIDDFGTGYSSFAHLQQFPFDVLKIDQSFIQRLAYGQSAEMLVHSQIQLAQALDIETVAEGVEEPYQLDFLLEEGCRSGQGFLLSRPLVASEIDDFIGRSLVPRAEPSERRPPGVRALLARERHSHVRSRD